MHPDRRMMFAVTMAALGSAVALTVFVAGAVVLFSATLSADERSAWETLTAGREGLVLLPGAVLVALSAALAAWGYRRHVTAPNQLAEQARVLLSAAAPAEAPRADGSPALQRLAQTLTTLARQRDTLRADVAAEVARASLAIEQERQRLAALMSELTQSVVVCNLDGRILLYNQRARWQFRTLSEAPQLTAGAELLGLGRSIYRVFDRELVAHALERVQLRLQRGAEQPTAQFVTTTRSGQLLRAQMAPVLGVEDRPGDKATDGSSDEAPPAPVITGFVLMLDNITREVEQGRARERLLHHLREGVRVPVSRLKARSDQLTAASSTAVEVQALVRALHDDIHALDAQVEALVVEAATTLATHWPLEDMRGADLVQAAARRIERQASVRLIVAEVDPELWLRVDSDALLQSVCHLTQRMASVRPMAPVTLRLHAKGERHGCLDLVGPAEAIGEEMAGAWMVEPIAARGSLAGFTVQEVAARHGALLQVELEEKGEATAADSTPQACWRFTLPLADAAAAKQALEAAAVRFDSRPAYYDFDLFARRDLDPERDDQRLSELSFTIFDTETTGLDPARDEIIQVGAVRMVNGKLLRGELFDQLVHPGRPIPPASIPIHGITDEMVHGQPTIEAVLPAFHRYARDTVLVAHNAAFDMRFLQRKESLTGAIFDQPVLDTLLLSEVVHPSQDSHRLELIAERLGVTVIGRHTALGDAMVTAEVFRRLLPLLADRGIHTLSQALAAAQRTDRARIQY